LKAISIPKGDESVSGPELQAHPATRRPGFLLQILWFPLPILGVKGGDYLGFLSQFQP
jgi:hypothetical protein